MGIMGGSRGQVHYQIDTKLVDLNTLVKPHLVVLDAYPRALPPTAPPAATRPTSSSRRRWSSAPTRLPIDAYGCSFFDMQPADVPHIKEAGETRHRRDRRQQAHIQKGTA